MTDDRGLGNRSEVGQDSLAAVLMTSKLASDGVKPLAASEYWKRPELANKPSELLGASSQVLCNVHGLAKEMADRINALMDRSIAMAFELDRLQHSGIHTLTPFDQHYPCQFRYRLRDKAPVVLHAAGPLELLDRPGFGVVGSRDIGVEGAEVAKSAARLASRMGLPVVSGGARGVDSLAMNAAVNEHRAGGSAVGYLADSLERQLKQPDTRRAILDEQILLCTPYRPDGRFTAGRAMGRNKLIYAGALVTLVVASDKDTGGTWSGAVEALKHRYGPVAVWRGPGEGPGNEHLEHLGATPVSSFEVLETLLIDVQSDPIPTETATPLEAQSQLPLPLEISVNS